MVAAVLMNGVFKSVFGAIGRQNHTLLGGSKGIINAYTKSLATLDTMVEKIPGSKQQKERHTLSLENLSCVKARVRLANNNKDLAECNQNIVSSVQSLRHHFESHFNHVLRVQYKAAAITLHQLIAHAPSTSFILVPSPSATAAAMNLIALLAILPEVQREQWPMHMKVLLDQKKPLRSQ